MLNKPSITLNIFNDWENASKLQSYQQALKFKLINKRDLNPCALMLCPSFTKSN